MNPIKATVDGNPVVILSRRLAFGSKHVAQGRSLELRKDGDYYVPIGRSAWEETVDQAGGKVSDRGGNFRLNPPELFGHDVALFRPCDPKRGFPDEAIEPATAVKAGDRVQIQSRASGLTVNATVTSVDESDFMIHVDTAFISGDSGSVVTTDGDKFVGFASTTNGISVPNLGMLIGTTPAPKPPQPIPTPAPAPTQADLDAAVAAAKAGERAQIKQMLTALASQY